MCLLEASTFYLYCTFFNFHDFNMSRKLSLKASSIEWFFVGFASQYNAYLLAKYVVFDMKLFHLKTIDKLSSSTVYPINMRYLWYHDYYSSICLRWITCLLTLVSWVSVPYLSTTYYLPTYFECR